nr:NepR family anti-sigma factor [Methylobacterium planeticum]
MDRRAETPTVAPLSPSVRRHLGRSLQALYAETLSAPVGARLEALLARLDPRKS